MKYEVIMVGYTEFDDIIVGEANTWNEAVTILKQRKEEKDYFYYAIKIINKLKTTYLEQDFQNENVWKKLFR